jgi:hypothetical protein
MEPSRRMRAAQIGLIGTLTGRLTPPGCGSLVVRIAADERLLLAQALLIAPPDARASRPDEIFSLTARAGTHNTWTVSPFRSLLFCNRKLERTERWLRS